MDTRRFVVGPDDAGDRLDAFLASACDGVLSRSRMKALIEAGAVASRQTALSPKRKVDPGDEIELALPAPEEPTRGRKRSRSRSSTRTTT